MNIDPEISFFIHGTRACALQMLRNASYIQRELPSLDIPGELRIKIEAVCGSLIGTKHDVITETFELEELCQTGALETKIDEKMGRISRWLCESLGEMHELVMEVERLVSADPRHGLVFFLIAESAINIATSIPESVHEENGRSQTTAKP
jgi:hypothetical protein